MPILRTMKDEQHERVNVFKNKKEALFRIVPARTGMKPIDKCMRERREYRVKRNVES